MLTELNNENIMLDNLIRCNLDILFTVSMVTGLIFSLLSEYQDYAEKRGYVTNEGYFYISIPKISDTLYLSQEETLNAIFGLQRAKLIDLRKYTDEDSYIVRIFENNVKEYLEKVNKSCHTRSWHTKLDEILIQGRVAEKLQKLEGGENNAEQ